MAATQTILKFQEDIAFCLFVLFFKEKRIPFGNK